MGSNKSVVAQPAMSGARKLTLAVAELMGATSMCDYQADLWELAGEAALGILKGGGSSEFREVYCTS